jgi:hypothetical protein
MAAVLYIESEDADLFNLLDGAARGRMRSPPRTA